MNKLELLKVGRALDTILFGENATADDASIKIDANLSIIVESK